MATNILIFVILVILKSVTSSTLNVNVDQVNKIFHGRYTRDVSNPELIIPRHVHHDGKFKSFVLPNYYSRNEINAKRKRSSPLDTEEDKLHLILPFNGNDHHIELTPFHDFISPDMVIETRGEGVGTNLTKSLKFKRASDEQCHYRGFIRGHGNSRAALSLCDGVAGYITINDGRFFIEPLDNSQPGSHGQHVHMIYKHDTTHEEKETKKTCGTSDDWETAWAEQLEKRERRLMRSGSLHKLNRGNEQNVSSETHSIHRYLEMALVADKKFLDFWQGHDKEKYILTLMNMAADRYHDASIGNQIDFIVVRIIYLEAESEEKDLQISKDSDKTLETFAVWAKKINSNDTSHPNHFDIAVLVSRHDFCSESAGCSLTGLAYVGTACDPDKSVGIVEDSGLLTGVVITHEVGHVMGCSHDTIEISGCKSEDFEGSYFIMSPYAFIYSFRWSTCSRKYISNLLNSELGDCLMNDPKNPSEKFQYPNMLPGAMYDSDFQCSMMEPKAVTCLIGGNFDCTMLWCRMGMTCMTEDTPPAEGTKCGENEWCIRKKCVPMGSRPNAVNGEWGEWGTSGECSRTCGGGIKVTERECDNPKPSNGGKYCLGERRKIEVCNHEPCDPMKPTFRAEQCSAYDDDDVLGDGLHTWIPIYKEALQPCLLYCVNENNDYVQMGVASDGTPCKIGTNDLCISGKCREVGCDWVLNSGAIEDRCHVCQGDGTQCTFFEGDYTDLWLFGYRKVVTIPKGAKGIKVFEKAATRNALAVKLEHSNDYCLNGKFTITYPREMDCAGSRLVYSEPNFGQEEFEIRGPITEDIEIQVLFIRFPNPGIHYEYMIPKAASRSYKPDYIWDFVQWSECDVNCGGGTMISLPNCIEKKNGIVSESFCKNLPRPPPKTQICNDYPCASKWRVTEWSKCSACKGHQGEQTRKVQCVKSPSRSNDDDIQVDLKYCKGSPPKQIRQCKGTRPCRPTCHPKSSKKTIDNSSLVKKSTRKNSGNMNNSINNDLMRYVDEADDNDGSGINKNTKDELEKLLHDWLLEHKDKRMCGDNKYLIEVETNEVKTPLETSTASEESKSTSSEAQIESSTIEAGLKLETTEAESTVTSIIESQQGENVVTEDNTEIKSLSTLKPGTLIRDEFPNDKTVLIEVPIKDDSFMANLSDIAFRENGDSPHVQIDTSQEKIYTGPEARKRINEMAYGNIKDITDLPDEEVTAEDSVE
ncbi:hypothetical protein PV327_003854 [Microctonus hyperodae]|uniref:Peptidase M12B domain-containing protein n=1 Tax=Microctonus hyperodae TaxID=165561 RepID=A0AA39G5B5_MICHY|nr:hypothetical protein PV327_003854 [Microctonus hyperodae]